MILSIQRLKELSSGGTVLAKWAIIYYLSSESAGSCTHAFALK